MGDEAEAVKEIIEAGATARLDISTIKKAVQLLRFLRSADATVDCLRMILSVEIPARSSLRMDA